MAGVVEPIPPLVGHFRFEALGTPDGRGHVANPPSCVPFLILSPALKRWGPLDGRGYVANLKFMQ